MTRRPIFIGVMAILALALTAGIAFGAGRLMGPRSPGTRQGGHQLVGATAAVSGSYANHRTQDPHSSTYGPALWTQMRHWMWSWMRDHRWVRQPRLVTRSHGAVSGTGSALGASGYHHDRGYAGDHRAGSSHWSGPNAGGWHGGGRRGSW